MTPDYKTDADICRQIVALAQPLQDAIQEAINAGLDVQMQFVRVTKFRTGDDPRISFKITRPIAETDSWGMKA